MRIVGQRPALPADGARAASATDGIASPATPSAVAAAPARKTFRRDTPVWCSHIRQTPSLGCPGHNGKFTHRAQYDCQCQNQEFNRSVTIPGPIPTRAGTQRAHSPTADPAALTEGSNLSVLPHISRIARPENPGQRRIRNRFSGARRPAGRPTGRRHCPRSVCTIRATISSNADRRHPTQHRAGPARRHRPARPRPPAGRTPGRPARTAASRRCRRPGTRRRRTPDRVRLAGRDHVVVGLVVPGGPDHRVHVVRRPAPVPAGVQVAQRQLVLLAAGDPRGALGDLAGDEGRRPARRLVVVEDHRRRRAGRGRGRPGPCGGRRPWPRRTG